MERRRDWIGCMKVYGFMMLLLFSSFLGNPKVSALSVTVNDVECFSEYVLYEGDTVSGNFVVVDHDIFWNSDHPGIDLIDTSMGEDVEKLQNGELNGHEHQMEISA